MKNNEGKLTAVQKGLLRHALGLPNTNKRSYRKYFVTGAGSNDYDDWNKMVEMGFAICIARKVVLYGDDDIFHVSRAGALAVLHSDESLCTEDFPLQKAGASS